MTSTNDTALRELCFCIAIESRRYGYERPRTDTEFNEYLQHTEIKVVQNLQFPFFNFDNNAKTELLIQRHYDMGDLAYDMLRLTTGEIIWTGPVNTKNSIADVSVGNLLFSLKDNSKYLLNGTAFIEYLSGISINNIGNLYDLAPAEYNHWFKYCWQKFCNYLETEKYSYKGIDARTYSKNHIIIGNSNAISYNIDVNIYNNRADIRKVDQKVFAHWITDYLSNDDLYFEYKKAAGEAVGRALLDMFQNATKYKQDFYSMCRIEEYSYFYCALDSYGNISLMYVPSINELTFALDNIDFTHSADGSQLNLFVRLYSKLNPNIEVMLIVECRYSHGQFVGKPETKVKYKDFESGEHGLSKIYDLIYAE